MDTYTVLDLKNYYRKGVYRHFTEDCKCSVSMTGRIDVTQLRAYSHETDTKFYLNFLYILSKVLNSREDFRCYYDWQKNEIRVYDVIHPLHYVFREKTETCTPVYSHFSPDYHTFYLTAISDIEKAKGTDDYLLDAQNHPNWFDASYLKWFSYDALNVELPDGYLYLAPIVNWGKYREEDGKYRMPVTVRLNHAIADGYLLSKVFLLLEKEIEIFCGEKND